jgi:hypothetical protein
MAKEKKSDDKKGANPGNSPGQKPIIEIIQNPTGSVIIRMMETPSGSPEIKELNDVSNYELTEMIKTFKKDGYKVIVSVNKNSDKNENSAKVVS